MKRILSLLRILGFISLLVFFILLSTAGVNSAWVTYSRLIALICFGTAFLIFLLRLWIRRFHSRNPG